MSAVVVLAGGSPHAHDFDAIRDALVVVVTSAGHDVTATSDPDDAVTLLDTADALVVDGLWWRMAGDAYDRWRAAHAYSPPAATRRALMRFVADGGAMVALHTTAICFDDWPEWGDVVGGKWQWGISSHPPFGPVSADVVAERSTHPVVVGLPATISLDDEVYGDLDLHADLDVLVTARRDGDDTDQPVVWTHRYGDGRVVFDGFGHDAASIRHPDNSRLITQALAWTLVGDA